MSTVDFFELWPGGNTTALVTTPLSRARYKDVAHTILKAHPAIEQVGFLEKATLNGSSFRLQMMGGEFCGNAARAAAFWWAEKHGQKRVAFEVSGLDAVIQGETTTTASRVTLPGAFFVHAKPVTEGWLIDLAGIRHLIVTRETDQNHTAMIQKYQDNCPAVGAIYLTRTGGIHAIDPYVWVRETDTLFHETACGSGSIAAAIAVALTPSQGTKEIVIKQPSGEIFSVVAAPAPAKGSFTSFALSGPAKILSTSSV